MEQLTTKTPVDNERMFQILTDLTNTNKEVQIMITVPGEKREEGEMNNEQ